MSEREIFLAAIDLPAAARAEFLDTACGTDRAVRGRVESLLRSHEEAGSFLGTPAVSSADPDNAGTVAFTPPVDAAARPDAEEGDDEIPIAFLAPSTRPDSLGRIGHYEVLQVLGKGGFGIVFRAFDDVLQRVVAVKVMAPLLAATSPARKRFLREARSAAAVRHENVVRVYEVAEQPLPHLVMEFIPGETLQQTLDRTGPLDVAEVVRIGRQIAEGLAAAHATDLIHRDIKPGNILLEGGHHKVKITDFGLARAADDASISQSGIIAGTPMYMAPEQAKGEHLDHRADLFSLGSVLYQMTAGRPPFRANGSLAVLKRVAEDTPRPIREITPETPQWLCDIIAKLHAKKPDDRYQSAREVADVLADCEAQLKGNSKLKDFSRIPVGKTPSAARSGRWKWVAAAALLLPLLALAVTELAGVTHLFRGQQATNDPPVSPTTANDLHVVTGPTDLIPFARPDLSGGRWEARDGKLFHPVRDTTGFPALPLAVSAPDEFDIEAEIERTDGAEFVAFGMSAYRHRFQVALDTWGKWAGVQAVDGELLNKDPARREGPWLTNGRRHSFRCEVRASGIRAWLDGRAVADYRGSYDALDIRPPDMPNWVRFFVQAKDDCGVVVHKLVLTPRSSAPPPAAHPGALPSTFKNGIGMEFAIVPKGRSWLGGSNGKPGDKEVEIKEDFYLGKYEVTQEEWEKVMGENPSHFSRTGGGKDAVKDIPDADLKRFPVESVSWDQCQIFVAKLNKLAKETGWVYRLPKEAEWEYACRGGPMPDKADSAFDFYFAEPTNTLRPEQANFGKESGKNRTCAVGSYQPNRLGLFDMHGNVWEWCQDEKEDEGVTKRLPLGGSLREGAGSGRAGFRRTPHPPSHLNYSIGLRLARVPASAPSAEAKSPAAVGPFTDADVKRIAALPAAEQVEEVRKELVRRNPGFDGTVGHKIEDGVVTEIKVVTDQVKDVAPIRVFNALRVLDLNATHTDYKGNGQLADLSPLAGMNLAGLTALNLGFTKVGDAGLVHFKDCANLTYLNLDSTQVTDAALAYFKNCPNLSQLLLGRTKINDAGLAHFKNCKKLILLDLSELSVGDAGLGYFKDCEHLTRLGLGRTQVTDAGPAHFKNFTKLQDLNLFDTQVGNAGLAHFKDCKELTRLSIGKTKVTDLSLLKGTALKELYCDFQPGRDAEILRSIKTLEKINGKPAAEFWKDVEQGKVGFAPFTDADVKRIAALPAAEQVEEVRKELVRRNPGFDGTVGHKIEDGVVTEIKVVTDQVKDVAPIRVFNALRVLDLNATHTDYKGNGQLADLSPLAGMNLAGLTALNLGFTKVGDAGLAHFKDYKSLTFLQLENTRVTDAGLTHLAGLEKLTALDLTKTKVTAKGVEGLAKALPKCKIDWDGSAIPPPPSDPDRRAAEYALSVGGSVRVNEQDRELKAAADLPKEAFRLTAASLRENKQVTDAGLAAFKGCKTLAVLDLSFTEVGDAGLAHFGECKAMTSLDIRFTKLTSAGLATIKEWKALTYLNLTACDQVTDAGLEHLSGCKKLEGLALDGTQVTDAGLAHLKGCGNLKELQLPGLAITDEGLAYLAGLDQLTELNLVKTKVTAKGAEGLAKALPKCKITWDGGTLGPK